MPTDYTIQQGDCLVSIARKHGFDDWRVIYNHPANATFKQNHPDPNLIYPGEVLVIPEPDQGGASGPTEKKNKFEITLDHAVLRMVIKDLEDKPYTGKPYKLTLGVLPPVEGETDGAGLIEKPIDPTVTTGRLEVFIFGRNEAPAVWTLLIGHLDPVSQKSGQQARLNNLGFESGTVDNIDGPITRGAVKRFQAKYGLQVDGVVGQQTRPKIESEHGC